MARWHRVGSQQIYYGVYRIMIPTFKSVFDDYRHVIIEKWFTHLKLFIKAKYKN